MNTLKIFVFAFTSFVYGKGISENQEDANRAFDLTKALLPESDKASFALYIAIILDDESFFNWTIPILEDDQQELEQFQFKEINLENDDEKIVLIEEIKGGIDALNDLEEEDDFVIKQLMLFDGFNIKIIKRLAFLNKMKIDLDQITKNEIETFKMYETIKNLVLESKQINEMELFEDKAVLTKLYTSIVILNDQLKLNIKTLDTLIQQYQHFIMNNGNGLGKLETLPNELNNILVELKPINDLIVETASISLSQTFYATKASLLTAIHNEKKILGRIQRLSNSQKLLSDIGQKLSNRVKHLFDEEMTDISQFKIDQDPKQILMNDQNEVTVEPLTENFPTDLELINQMEEDKDFRFAVSAYTFFHEKFKEIQHVMTILFRQAHDEL